MTRTSAEIGRGLAQARPARPIGRGERIHVLGAAGAGASAALLLAHRAGAAATGCDPGGPSPYSQLAEELGLGMAWEHAAGHVARDGARLVDRLAVTKALTAIEPDHPELVAARGAGVPAEAWQQIVADAAATKGARLVAVGGTHGKSTTTGWLLHVLASAGRDPSGFVGALLPASLAGGVPSTARWGEGGDFVVEADEYAGNFDAYRPALAVLLNAEWDHPDVFADEGAVLDAFEAWIRRAEGASEPPVLVANAGDAGMARLLTRLADWPGRVVTCALDDDEGPRNVDVRGQARVEGGLRITLPGAPAIDPTLALGGRHNAANALCVGTAAWVLGLSADEIEQGLTSFPGVGRRLELKGEPRGVAVLDDYAHHPTAVAASIGALRDRYPGRRLWAVYEPLTFHRTAAMLDAFAEVLGRADRVAVADIWAGRDPDTSIVSSERLADAVRRATGTEATAPGSVEATADALAAAVEPGDIVLVMGGGRSYVIADRLVTLLGGSEPAVG